MGAGVVGEKREGNGSGPWDARTEQEFGEGQQQEEQHNDQTNTHLDSTALGQ